MTKARVTSKVVQNSRMKALEDAIKRLGSRGQVKVGIPDGDKDEFGTPLSLIASAHEFGIGVPERPFLRNTIKANVKNYARLNRINLVKMLNAQMTVDTALGQLGSFAVGHVRAFLDNNDYQLSPITIARKGSSRALIDTGGMKTSVDYEVGT